MVEHSTSRSIVVVIRYPLIFCPYEFLKIEFFFNLGEELLDRMLMSISKNSRPWTGLKPFTYYTYSGTFNYKYDVVYRKSVSQIHSAQHNSGG